jgi:hypothetical protein
MRINKFMNLCIFLYEYNRNKIEAVKLSPLAIFTPQFNYTPNPPNPGTTSTSTSSSNINENSTDGIKSSISTEKKSSNMKNNSNNSEAEKDAKRKIIMDRINVAKKITGVSRIPLDIGLGEGVYMYMLCIYHVSMYTNIYAFFYDYVCLIRLMITFFIF